jgi:hypothetical protein
MERNEILIRYGIIFYFCFILQKIGPAGTTPKMSFPRGPVGGPSGTPHRYGAAGGGAYGSRYPSPSPHPLFFGRGGSPHAQILPHGSFPHASPLPLRGMAAAPEAPRGVPVVLRPSASGAPEGLVAREYEQEPSAVSWRAPSPESLARDRDRGGVAGEPARVRVARLACLDALDADDGSAARATAAEASWSLYVTVADLENARARGSFPRERLDAEVERAKAEVERAKAEAKIAELEVRDPDGTNERVQGQIEQLRRAVAADKDAAAGRERRLAAEAQAVARAPSSAAPLASSSSSTPRPRAWLVEATVTGRTGQLRRRVHLLAQRCGGYYAVARREDEGHRGESIFWAGRTPSEGSDALASLEYGSAGGEGPEGIAARYAEEYKLTVLVAFGEARAAIEFRRLLQAWPTEGEASVATVVEPPRPLEDAFEELLTHELVEEEHYVHGTDTNTLPRTPPKDEGGLDRTLSHRTEQTLCKPKSPLGTFQGLDVRRGFRHNDSGEAAHLIDKAVVDKLGPTHPYREHGFLTLDDDHPTSSCNFVGASAHLHKLIDGRDGNREGTPVALCYVSHEPTPRTVGGWVQELDEHVRYEVHVDVVFRDNDRNAYLEDCTFVFDHVVDKDVTVNIGGNRQAVRVRLLVRNPAVFKYCVDWKFIKTAREWCAEGAGADVAVFGIDVGVYPDKVINPQFTEAYLYNSVATRAMTVLAEANNE